jgi:hypothetical protein
MRIDKAKVGSSQVLRCKGWTGPLMVSGESKDALDRMGATGTRFSVLPPGLRVLPRGSLDEGLSFGGRRVPNGGRSRASTWLWLSSPGLMPALPAQNPLSTKMQ